MSEKIIYIPKPWWWNLPDQETGVDSEEAYQEALEATSKTLGVIIKLEDQPPLYDTRQ